MPADPSLEPGSVHRLAFQHYLRTGQRLTSAEWLARYERKFNPYHDEQGRFTSPPGVTVSYGSRREPDDARRTARLRQTGPRGSAGSQAPSGNASGARSSAPQVDTARTSTGSATSMGASVDAAINKDWSPAAPIATRFDLNRRQFHLDTLRQKAGPNPNQVQKAAFEETQRRLDAARALLDENDRAADREVGEIFRAGAAPVDFLVGGTNIALGKGEFRDYFSVAGAIPLAGIVRGPGKLILGGAQSVVSKTIKEAKILVRVQHHVPAQGALAEAGIIIPQGKRTVIGIKPLHHEKTASWGSYKESKLYRETQARLLKEGRFSEAMKMDADDIDQISPGEYSEEIEQFMRHAHDELWSKRKK